jgi:hypothetical protein
MTVNCGAKAIFLAKAPSSQRKFKSKSKDEVFGDAPVFEKALS